jgi:teichuronic acid biosynthesis glycosyltransferase TuaC
VKVLVVSHLYPSPGYERHLFVEEQVKALGALGVTMRVLSPTGYAPRVSWVVPRLKRRGTTPRQAVRSGVFVEYPRVPVLPHLMLAARAGDLSYLALRRLLPELEEAGIDLVHAHQAMPDGAASRRLAAALDVPYVVTVHGRDVHHNLVGDDALARATALALREAAAVVGVSSAVARALEGVVAPERLFVNLNGFTSESRSGEGRDGGGRDAEVPGEALSSLRADIAKGTPVVLSVGYLLEFKGHEVVMRAIARLPEAERPAYVIAGDGPRRAHLRETARRLGLGSSVHLLGRRTHDDVLALMRDADLFVLPSSDEAFGLVYAEAMSQGTPVVGCLGQGLADFVEDGVSGFLIPARDDEALATLMARLLRDRATAAAAGEAGRAAVARLTWQANARRQLAIYRRALGLPDEERSS